MVDEENELKKCFGSLKNAQNGVYINNKNKIQSIF